MSDNLNLGEQLRKIRADKQAAARAAEEARVRAAYAKSENERIQIRRFWYDYVSYVSNQVRDGKEPAPKRLPDVFVQLGQRLDQPLHTHHDIWQEIVTGAHHLGLTVKLSHVHDGMGMKSWYEISVEPLS